MQIDNFLTGPTRVRHEKSTAAQEGARFEALRAKEETRKFERSIKEQFGDELGSDEARPQSGAFAIFDERMADVCLQLLEANGLSRFRDRLTIDWFTRNETLQKGKLEALKTPVASELVFQFPHTDKDSASVLFRIAVIDPKFADEKGQPLYKEIPKDYISAVLHTLNPYILYQIFGKALPDMLQRAGEPSRGFEQLIKFVAGKAKNRTTPSDLKTLQDYVHAMFIHETAHALALHLPDELTQDLTDEQRRLLESVTVDRYFKLINADQSLMASALFFKNLIKALQRVTKKQPSAETAAEVLDLLMLETFCDRFSMYLYENFLKIRAYNKYLQKLLGYPINIDGLIVLERARKSKIMSSRPEISGLSVKDLEPLEKELAAAELDHVFISGFGEPAVTSEERDFYFGFLTWLKCLDKKNQIMRFSRQHARTHRLMRVSVAGMTLNAGLAITGGEPPSS